MNPTLLLIMNPCAGTKRANRYLTDILSLFSSYGWETLVHMTQARGDGREAVERLANSVDRVVCIGGDGTYNECVDGLLASGAQIPLGYIPAGSTNDFAKSLHLSRNILQAARDIMEGQERFLDIGSFSGRHFTYVASFGAFTKTSYTTPQSTKNALGHLAYILEGIKDLSSIRPQTLIFRTPEKTVRGDYVFGAVSNSTSVAGILTISPKIVDLNDGKFEVLLVRMPSSPADLNEAIRALTMQDYSSYMIDFFSAETIDITASPNMDWTLDGEWQKGAETIRIENLHSAIRILTNAGQTETALPDGAEPDNSEEGDSTKEDNTEKDSAEPAPTEPDEMICTDNQ